MSQDDVLYTTVFDLEHKDMGMMQSYVIRA
jgi:hypothetical protein